ncbi:MAG TPA: PAS domain S-box protein [Terriglobales bacterium]|nr:PAS domain S-box protein [Terriglobales bacterium]
MLSALVAYGWLERLATVDNLADTASTLVLLTAGVLIYRTFRERYLFFWITGWSAYLLYQIGATQTWGGAYSRSTVVLTYAAFLISAGLFASAVFDYLQRRRWLIVVGASTAAAMAIVVWKVCLPNSPVEQLEWVFQILYRVGTFSAAILLVRFSRGRRQASPWVMSVMLFLMHIDFDISTAQDHANFDLLIQSLLGLSMLLLVLDESRTRTRRLDVVNEVIGTVATAEDEHAVMLVALQQIKRLMSAKAVWFRLIVGDQMEMRAHVGLTDAFLRTRWRIPLEGPYGSELIQGGEPIILYRRNQHQQILETLHGEKLDHMVVIPVQGKATVIGILVVGNSHSRHYRPDELRFLAAAARQLGIAIENLQLIAKILRSQRQWANTFDALPDPILVHDDSHRIIKANRALLNKLGTSQEAVVGRTCGSVLPHFQSTWKECPYCEGFASEFRDQPDPCFGGFATVSTTTYVADENGPGGTVHIIRDTTARRAAEERYRTLFEQVQEGVFVSTPDGRVIDCNDAFVHLLGYESRDDVLSKEIAQTFYAHPSDRNVFLQKMQKNGMVKNFEVNLKRKDGSMVTVLENSYASKTASGNIIRYHGVLLDITEKKRAEDEVRRRNRELEALNSIAVLASQSFDMDEIINLALRHLIDIFMADTAAIFLFDPDRQVLRRAAAFGHRSELGSNLGSVTIPADFRELLAENHVEIITQRELEMLPNEFKAFVGAEGLQSWAWVVMWSGGKLLGVLGISSRRQNAFSDRDEGLMIALGRQLANSTEKVRLYEETSKAYEHLRSTQEQLLQSEKMSAVGQLISGVAHELNNPLTAILGYSQLLEGEDLTEHQREFVSKLYKQAQRTHRVVQNLLSFARQRKPAKMPVDVRRIVEDTLALRDYDLNIHNIQVERNFPSTLGAVVADAHQLEQVFLNIINNAVDAILERSRGGKLEVSIVVQDAHVSLEFHDSGPGIKEVNRIFDPFYTTKSVGKGTGLGLSICYGIIKEHGGDIRAYNHPSGGAVLQVVLPMAAEAAVSKTADLSERSVPLQGRVLIVDDEEAVLDFEREVLAGAGAQVVCLNSAELAIATLAAEQFDAILVDSAMPGALNGIDVYRWLAEHRPESKGRVVLTLSSLTDSELRKYLEENGISYISKPFEVSDLIALTASAMQANKSAASAS